jgi:hypothetical protein
VSHRAPKSSCLCCGEVLDAATGIHSFDSPSPGSLSVCLYCGAVTLYGDDLRLRPLTAAEVEELKADAETMATIRRATGLIHFLKAARN